jgi:hypothetical protein
MFEQPPKNETATTPEAVEHSQEFIPITKAEVVTALDEWGITDPRAMAALREYEEGLSAATDVIASIDSHGAVRAEINRAMLLAQLYGETQKYKDEQRATLEEALVLASQSDEDADLAEQILAILETEAQV